jgi:hypothetical protein
MFGSSPSEYSSVCPFLCAHSCVRVDWSKHSVNLVHPSTTYLLRHSGPKCGIPHSQATTHKQPLTSNHSQATTHKQIDNLSRSMLRYLSDGMTILVRKAGIIFGCSPFLKGTRRGLLYVTRQRTRYPPNQFATSSHTSVNLHLHSTPTVYAISIVSPLPSCAAFDVVAAPVRCTHVTTLSITASSHF